MLGLGINMALGRQRFGAPAFSPSSLAGLVGWWDFSDASTLTLATAEVTAVASKTSTGFGDIVPVTTGPTLVSAGQNGLDYALFSTTPLTQSAEVPNLFLPGEATLFAVARVDAANRGLVDVHRGPTSLTNVGALIFSASAEGCIAQGRGEVLSSVTATDPIPGVAWRVFGGRYAGTGLTARINGVTADDATFDFISSPETLDGITVGGLSGNGMFYSAINTDFGEVLVYNTALTDSEMDEVEAYLEAKWGL